MQATTYAVITQGIRPRPLRSPTIVGSAAATRVRSSPAANTASIIAVKMISTRPWLLCLPSVVTAERVTYVGWLLDVVLTSVVVTLIHPRGRNSIRPVTLRRWHDTMSDTTPK